MEKYTKLSFFLVQVGVNSREFVIMIDVIMTAKEQVGWELRARRSSDLNAEEQKNIIEWRENLNKLCNRIVAKSWSEISFGDNLIVSTRCTNVAVTCREAKYVYK